MPSIDKIQEMKVTFKENGDVLYQIKILSFRLNVFQHYVDYPSNKIEIEDVHSIYPIYISKISEYRTLIEIKGSPCYIDLKYTKKAYLKKELISENQAILRYVDIIPVEISENLKELRLSIHSPYSYVSAVRSLSKASFNGVPFSLRDLYPAFLNKSGVMEIDWSLEVIDVLKETNIDKKRQYLNDWTQKDNVDTPVNEDYNLDYYIDLSSFKNKDRFPSSIFSVSMRDFLSGSCFYLSAGADITPIIALEDKVSSFIFCDVFECTSESFTQRLQRIGNKLEKHNFVNIGEVNLRKESFEIESFFRRKIKNTSLSIWQGHKTTISLLYLNWDNSMAFHSLFVKNKIVPSAICDILPDGGSIGQFSTIKIPFKFRLPKFWIGHFNSVGKADEYERCSNHIEYYGDYAPVDSNLEIFMFRRRSK